MFSLNISGIKQLLIKNNCGNVCIHFLWFRMNLSVLDQARRKIPKQYVRLWGRPGAVLSAQKAGSSLSEPWGQGRLVTEAHERLVGSSCLPLSFPGRESASNSAESVLVYLFFPERNRTGKILVNDEEQTSVPYVYAVGDVLEGKPRLTPVAVQAGKLLARRLFGGRSEKVSFSLLSLGQRLNQNHDEGKVRARGTMCSFCWEGAPCAVCSSPLFADGFE